MITEFAFILPDGPSVADSVLEQARKTFGDSAKYIGPAKTRVGTVRYLKNRGHSISKKGGKFFCDGLRLVWATVDVSTDHLVKQMGGTPGTVDLTDLNDATDDR